MTDSVNHSSDFGMRRIYAQPEPDEGRRVLVDRLWPRGVAKDDQAFDDWLKSIAPSSPLRVWYGHRPDRHDEFARRYRYELHDDSHREALEQLRSWRHDGPVTLLTASRDLDASHVPILVAVLEETKDDRGSLSTGHSRNWQPRTVAAPPFHGLRRSVHVRRPRSPYAVT